MCSASSAGYCEQQVKGIRLVFVQSGEFRIHIITQQQPLFGLASCFSLRSGVGAAGGFSSGVGAGDGFAGVKRSIVGVSGMVGVIL